MDSLYKILGIINRIIWIVIGLVVIFVLIKVGSNVINQAAGSAFGGNGPAGGQQFAPQQQQGQPNNGQVTTPTQGNPGTIMNSPVQNGQGTGQMSPAQPTGNTVVSPGTQNTVK